MGRRSLVVVPYNTKFPLATALKTFAPTVESRSFDLLLTPTAFESHPDIAEYAPFSRVEIFLFRS